MPDLTLTFPTRGRPESLKTFIRNMAYTITDPDNVEIIIQFDEDDNPTTETLWDCKHEYSDLNIVLIQRERGDNLSDHYYNWLVRENVYKGKYFWVGGDDFRILTEGWDVIIPREIEKYLADKPDRICYAFPKDKSTNKPKVQFDWGWFPILTREAIDALGFVFPQEAATWGADILIASIFNGVGRMLPIPEIITDHIGYHAYDMPKDETSKSMADRYHKTMGLVSRYRRFMMPLHIHELREKIGRMDKGEPVQ